MLTFEPPGFADVLIGDGARVDGGAGVNAMNVSANQHITVANPDARISGIQILNLNSVSGTIDVDLSRFDAKLTSITRAGDDQAGAYGNFHLTNLRPNLTVTLAAPVLYPHLQTDDGAIQLNIVQEGRDPSAGTISVIATLAMQALLTTGTADLSGINGGAALTGIDTLHVAENLALTKQQLEGFSSIVLDGNVAHHLAIDDGASQAWQQSALSAAHVFITNAGPETSFTIGSGTEMNLAQFLAAGYVDGVLVAGDLAQLVGQPGASSDAASLAQA